MQGFRQKQYDQAYYKDLITDWEQLTTWPKSLREDYAAKGEFLPLKVDKQFVSGRGDTVKVLFNRLKDGQRIETVLMRHKDGRNTVCVSCMVGCPVNCSFCATGKMGFGGNLTAEEIIEQVMYFQRYLRNVGPIGGNGIAENYSDEEQEHVDTSVQKVTNVVYMGMGEPMLNLRAVQASVDDLTAADKLGLSQRRLTVSTSGYLPQFRKFVEDGFRGRVAVSLHAPNQELRAKMMPVSKIYPLEELMAELDRYVELTNKRISYEYVLIRKLNDQDEHAMQLVSMFRNRLAHVNLIPYNPISEEKFERSTRSQIDRFTDILRKHGINFSVRVTMGDDVNAACGQLADRENKKAYKGVGLK